MGIERLAQARRYVLLAREGANCGAGRIGRADLVGELRDLERSRAVLGTLVAMQHKPNVDL